MSQKKTNKSVNPIAFLAKKKIGSTHVDEPDRSLGSDVDSSQEEKPKMKRLKKMKHESQSQELINEESSEEGWDPKEGEKFEKFMLADDDDLKKKAEQQEDQKKKKKMKGNQEIDKFIGGNKESKKSAKPPKKQMQMSLMSMLQAGSKQKKRKDSFEQQMANIDIKEDSNDIDEEELNRKVLMAYQDYNAGKNQRDAIAEACKLSMAEQKNNKGVSHQKYSGLNNYQYEADKKQPISKEQKKSDDHRRSPVKPVAHNISKSKDQPRKRSKSAPKKKEKVQPNNGPLNGKILVFTGEFEPYKKGHLSQLFTELGANCPKSLVKKATHLLQGDYVADQFGRRLDQDIKQTSKSKQAESRGIEIVPRDQLDNFLIKFTGKSLQELMKRNTEPPRPQKSMDNMMMDMERTGTKTEQPEQRQETEQMVDEREQIKPQKAARVDRSRQTQEDNWQVPARQHPRVASSSVQWTEKYKPQNIGEIIGQHSQIKSLREWLESWEDIHIRGNKREVKASFNSFLPSGNINSAAALLSGDAGLGKTTTARLLAAEYGYGVVEFNASDARNKKKVELIAANKDNTWLSMGKTLEKSLLIMDEVDGMSSGDRGGIAAIINIIKKSKIPIICICNDRQSTKIRSLAGHCLDVKFHRPDKRMLVKRIAEIITKEGGTSTEKGLERIVEMLQNDVRQIITYVQMMFRTVSKDISYNSIDKNGDQSKDSSLMMNHFEASKKLLNRSLFRGMTISQRVELTFVDSSMVPLMVQENYLAACQKKPMNKKQFHNLVKATESLVTSDLIDKTIMKNQNYCLMPNKMFTGCVYPAEMVCQGIGFPKFISFLGKFSTEKKQKRLIKEMKNALMPISMVSTNFSVKSNYVPMLFEYIYRNLKAADADIDAIVLFMDHYNITPAILAESVTVLQYGDRENLLKDVPAAAKAKLTRAYNKHHQATKFKKVKAKAQGAAPASAKYDPVLGQMQDDNVEQEESEKQEEEDVGVVEKKPAAKPKKKK